VAAALVLRPGHPKHTDVPAELRARCTEQLAAYKRPRRWYLLDELPRTASGKVRKHELRDLLAEREPVLSERQ
jgi:acyl-coenzyme A synthetase/AMP-(fatty) acid ligase